MAASSFVPARTRPRTRRGPRELAAHAAARTAPRGPGLALVVPLPVRATIPGATAPLAVPDVPAATERPALRVVAPVAHPRRGVRTVAAILAGLLVLGGGSVLLRTVLAGPAEPVAAGHVVLQPGETLWDIAVRSAPAGVDARRQLDRIRRLNGFGPGALDAWTVVLVPAP
jgi:Tfp pilus assembly protein FimV